LFIFKITATASYFTRRFVNNVVGTPVRRHQPRNPAQTSLGGIHHPSTLSCSTKEKENNEMLLMDIPFLKGEILVQWRYMPLMSFMVENSFETYFPL